MKSKDNSPLNWDELTLTIADGVAGTERTVRTLEDRLKAIVTKLLDWESDIEDQRAGSVQVVLDCKGESVRVSVRKME